MSTSVTPSAPGATTGAPGRNIDTSPGATMGIPDPRGTSSPVPSTSGSTTGTTGTRFVAVVLVSVVLSVAASTSVVTLTGTGTGADGVRLEPAAVVQQDQGQEGAEQDAVEQDASTKLGEIRGGRDDSFCQSPSHPPVAC